MVNVRNSAIGIVIAVALLYALVKGYVYFRVQSAADNAVAMAQPFATISYDGISSDLGGAVALHQVEVRTERGTLPLRIGTLELRGPGFGFLLDLAGGLDPREPSEWIELSLRGVELPHPQDLTPDLKWSVAGASIGDDAEPCSLEGLLKRAGVLQSGEFPLYLDAGMGYRGDVEGGAMSTHLFYRVAGGDSLDLELVLSALPDPRMAMLGRVPPVKRIDIGYLPDPERVTAAVQKCAEGGLTKEAYVAGLAREIGPYFARTLGFVPGAGLSGALQRLLLAPGEVRITARPDQALFQAPMVGLTAEQLVPLMDLTVTVAGQPVEDLSFGRELSPSLSVSSGSASDAQLSGAADGAAPVPAPEPMQFQETSVAELGGYLYRQVRLRTSRRDTPVEGRLISLSDDKASVEQRIHHGKWTVHVPLGSITSAEVLRRKEGP